MVIIPPNPAELKRGASWLELTLDFIATTGALSMGARHFRQTNVDLVKNAFSALSRVLALHVGSGLPLGTVSLFVIA